MDLPSAVSNVDSTLTRVTQTPSEIRSDRLLVAYSISCCNVSVDVFTNDSVSPILQSFDLDLTFEILTLYFSETVNVDTF